MGSGLVYLPAHPGPPRPRQPRGGETAATCARDAPCRRGRRRLGRPTAVGLTPRPRLPRTAPVSTVSSARVQAHPDDRALDGPRGAGQARRTPHGLAASAAL